MRSQVSFFTGQGKQVFVKDNGPFIIFLSVHGNTEFGALPYGRGRRLVKFEKLRMAIQVGTDVLPFKLGSGFPFRPEQRVGSNRLHPGAVRKAAVTGIVRAQRPGFPVQGNGGVNKDKGIIPGRPDYAPGAGFAYNMTVAGKYILFGTGDEGKTRFLRKRRKGRGRIFGTGQDLYITGKGEESFHYAKDQGTPPKGKQGFSGETA